MKNIKKTLGIIFVLCFFAMMFSNVLADTQSAVDYYTYLIGNISDSETVKNSLKFILKKVGGETVDGKNIDYMGELNYKPGNFDFSGKLIGEDEIANDPAKALEYLFNAAGNSYDQADKSEASKKLEEIGNRDDKTPTGIANKELADTTKEYVAASALESQINILIQTATKDCEDTGGSINPNGTFEFDGETFYCDTIFKQDENGETKLNDNISALQEAAENVREQAQEKRQKTIPLASQEAIDAAGVVKQETDETVDKAATEFDFDIQFTPPTPGEKPEFSLGNLSDRVNNLGTKENEDIVNMLKFVNEDLVGIVKGIGVFIMYASILFFGVRTIWTGVEGKTQFKEMLPYLLAGIVFFELSEGVFELAKEIATAGQAEGSVDYEAYAGALWGSVLNLVRILAFGGIIFTGVKLLFAGPDGKADVKKSLLPVLVGSIIVFASSTVVTLVIDVAKDAGIDSSYNVIYEENTISKNDIYKT